MRGKNEQQLDVFSHVSPEERVPQDHPLRPLRVMTDVLRKVRRRGILKVGWVFTFAAYNQSC